MIQAIEEFNLKIQNKRLLEFLIDVIIELIFKHFCTL